MTKKDIVLAVSRTLGMRRRDVQAVLDAAFECIIESIHKGRRIELRNFGVFAPKRRRERVIRNPMTGKLHRVRAKRTVGFKPGKRVDRRLTGRKRGDARRRRG